MIIGVGKTTLCLKMVRKKRASRTNSQAPKGTIIGIDTLDVITFELWDLGEQGEFHGLHDLVVLMLVTHEVHVAFFSWFA